MKGRRGKKMDVPFQIPEYAIGSQKTETVGDRQTDINKHHKNEMKTHAL